jgi:predicted nucleic-acid-binding protein
VDRRGACRYGDGLDVIGIDTNVLLRWLVDDPVVTTQNDRQRALAVDLIENSGERFFINQIVLAETIWVLRRKVKHENAVIAGLVERLLQMSDVVVQDATSVAVAVQAFRSGAGDFADHLIGTVNAAEGCRTTWTFDHAASRSPHFSLLGDSVSKP